MILHLTVNPLYLALSVSLAVIVIGILAGGKKQHEVYLQSKVNAAGIDNESEA